MRTRSLGLWFGGALLVACSADPSSDPARTDSGSADGAVTQDAGSGEAASTDGATVVDFGPPIETPIVCNGDCVYVRAGATGAATGDDWTNAFTSLPTKLVRGKVYFIAGGATFPGRTLDQPVDAQRTITIKGAALKDHGTDVGWSDAYSVETAPVTWSSGFLFKSSYWVIDGSSGSMTKTPSAYGFAMSPSSSPFRIGDTVGPSYSDIRVSHVYAKAVSADVEKLFLQGGFQVGAVNRVTVSHSLLDGWQNGMMARGQGGAPCDGWVFDHNLALNGSSTSSNHGEWLNANSAPLTNLRVSFNWFEGNSGNAGLTGVVVANNNNNTNAVVYGNVFYKVSVGNGIISGTSAGKLNGAKVHDNTFVSCNVATDSPLNGPGTGNVASNNLFYGMPAGITSFTSDYDLFAMATKAPNEANGQIMSASPFVNVATADFHLQAATQKGTTLPSPFDVDAEGRIRGKDGSWDRGAYELGP